MYVGTNYHKPNPFTILGEYPPHKVKLLLECSIIYPHVFCMHYLNVFKLHIMNLQDAVAILGSRITISQAGKYTVKVTNCSDFHKALARGAQVAIANFNAMNSYQDGKAREFLQAGDIEGALKQNLSLSIRDTDYRPSKGEIVDIMVEEVQTKDGEVALLVSSLTPIKAQAGKKADFSSFLTEVPAEAPEAGDEA